ncbi:MAG TPA: hypothetical protein VLF43_04825 [Candidatus Saccharimonadales bacterium]|nr:hypothetical protein [Candidatus Saccharimonadales bacterium]
MNPDEYNQGRPNQPLSSGRDWQAQAVYGATHPDYNPQAQNPNLRPVPNSEPTAPIYAAPNMPAGDTLPSLPPAMPLPMPGQEGPQQPTATPYIPPTSYTPPAGQEAPEYKPYSARKQRRWPAVLITLIIIVLVAGVGYTGYNTFFVNDDPKTTADKPTNPTPNPAPTPQPTTKPAPAVDLASLNTIAINPPADLSGLTAKPIGADTVKNYIDASGTCNLQFGTLSATDLPGNNINELVAKQLDSLRKAGATVDGPKDIDLLVLKDATDSAVTYKMPTVRISFTNGKKHGLSYYSAVILKGGTRAFISRSCVNTNGDVDQNAFNAVEAKAKQLTVTKQL